MVTLPLQTTHGRQHRQATMHILKRFEFEPSLMRSGVVAVERSHGKLVSKGVLIIKGAAPAIEQQIGTDRLPPNYRKVTIAVMIAMSVPLPQQRQSDCCL